MSSFHVVEVMFKDEPLLIQSLKDLGYSPTIHKEGKVLEGNYNRNKVKGHIVIPKSQFNGTYGDIGFERTKKGFVMNADHIDINKFKMKQLNKTYCENKLKKYVRSTSRCNIFSRKENSNGQLEIQLRIQQ
jgi:hypothetical protein